MSVLRLSATALLLASVFASLTLESESAYQDIIVRETKYTNDGYDFFDTSRDKEFPPCTEKQSKLVQKSRLCYSANFGPGRPGICPPDCCCDILVRPDNSTRLFGAVGYCFYRGTVNQKREVIALAVVPYSPLETGSSDKCAKTTKDICGPVIGKGCTLHALFLPHEGESKNSSQSSSKSSKETDSDSKSTRNKILLSTCVSFLLLLVFAAIAWFIVLPWLRGTSRSSESGSTEDDDTVEPENLEQLHMKSDRVSLDRHNIMDGIGSGNVDDMMDVGHENHERNMRGGL